MNTTVKDRLIAYIEHKGLSKNKFEKMCGLGTRYVSNISQSISPAIVKKISLTFPELNMGWVLTGKGEMIEKSPEASESSIAKSDLMKLNLNLSETIRQQQETIQLLTKMLSQHHGQ